MKRFVRGCLWSCLTLFVACGDDDGAASDENASMMAPEVGQNMASFDVTGTWEGSATDEDTKVDVVLEFNNNGGAQGRELTGTLTLKGLVEVDFTGFIDPFAGAQRVFMVDASDEDGFSYTLRGTLTDKRLDKGQLESSNPAVGVSGIFLETNLLKKP